MKLVQMPRDLLTVEVEDLAGLGVHPALIDAVAARCAGDPLAIRSLALLGPREAGTTPALMVLARLIGAALRDANIRLRDGGGNLRAGRLKLCYLPGSALPAALAAGDARRALEAEAALFIENLDGADGNDAAVAALLAERRRHGARTFVSADPVWLPPSLLAAVVAALDTVTVPDGD